MAETKREPIVKLPAEMLVAIKKAQEDMPQLRKEVDALKRMAMDTTQLDEKLDWVENVSKIMLDTYT